MVPTKYETHAVDTRRDADLVERLLEEDYLTNKYIESI